MAQNRIGYHVKEREEMSRIAETSHHEGIVFITSKLPNVEADTAIANGLGESKTGKNNVKPAPCLLVSLTNFILFHLFYLFFDGKSFWME